MKIHDPKRKCLSLFQSKLHSITINSVIDYILEVHTTNSSLKKKNLKRERGKENEMDKGEGKEVGGKEENKKKGMERVCAEGKEKGRMRCGRKEERKEERMKEKKKEKKGEEEKEE